MDSSAFTASPLWVYKINKKNMEKFRDLRQYLSVTSPRAARESQRNCGLFTSIPAAV
jgi:hypothetical protein